MLVRDEEKMKIGIVAANNIRYSPYIYFYTQLLDEINVKYEVILPNRNQIKDSFKGIVHEFNWDENKHSLFNYFKYSRYVEKVIKENNYDFVIVLTTIMSVFLCGFLSKNYFKKYLVDCRDYTYEHNSIYYWIESKAMRNSKLNVISSPYFREFLPKLEYDVCHNINITNSIKYQEFDNTDRPIKIGYIGSVMYYEQCEALIKLVDHDSRFEFHVFGKGPESARVKNLIESKANKRIAYHGAYVPSEKESIIKYVDILFNTYGNDTKLVKYALSNKLYDALFYKKALLTNTNTAMYDAGGKLAFAIDYDNAVNLDELYDWYISLEKEIVMKNSRDLLNKYFDETIKTKENVKKAVLFL